MRQIGGRFSLELAAALHVTLPKMLIFTVSKNVATGFHWIDSQPVKRRDNVIILVLEWVRELVQEPGYLLPDAPLIKGEVSVDGEKIGRNGEDILINGVTVAVTQ